MRADKELRIITNEGSVIYKEVADSKGLPLKVRFNKDSLASVLSFKQVLEFSGVIITADTSKEDAFSVHLKDGMEMKFR